MEEGPQNVVIFSSLTSIMVGGVGLESFQIAQVTLGMCPKVKETLTSLFDKNVRYTRETSFDSPHS